MSVTTIRFRRGLEASIPSPSNGNIGEPLWATDSKKLFVSNGNENVEIGAVTITGTLQSGTTIATINGTPIYAPAQVNSDWNASSGVSQILNKPTIPDAVSYSGAGTASGGTYTIGTLTIGTDPYTLSCPDATITNPQYDSSTGVPIVTIGGTVIYGPAAGQTVTSIEEVYAYTPSNGTSAIVSTDPNYGTNPRTGVQTVTFKHAAVNQGDGSGSFATFVAGASSSGNIDVTMSITVIDGGSF